MRQSSEREQMARELYFDHVDQHGYPNGMPMWDEMPERIERRISIETREHWRSLADAALAYADRLITAERERIRSEAFAEAAGVAEMHDHRGDIAKAILALSQSSEPRRSEADEWREALNALAKDFRNRAHVCRTNLDAFCPKSAAVWDFAAEAVKEKRK